MDTAIADGVSYKAFWVISGRLNTDGNKADLSVSNLHGAFLMHSKGDDPQKKVSDAGTIKVFHDPDLVSEMGTIRNNVIAKSILQDLSAKALSER